jgi:hypothetical protein
MWSVTAFVRQRGAIGVFYRRHFVVNAPLGASIDCVKDAWFAEYGEWYELEHFGPIEESANG